MADSTTKDRTPKRTRVRRSTKTKLSTKDMATAYEVASQIADEALEPVDFDDVPSKAAKGRTGVQRGYARVSTTVQDTRAQITALEKAGCVAIYEETMSGGFDNRPELRACLKALVPGDTLVVWKLDRLGRSTQHLIATVTALQERGIAFKSLTENIDSTTPGGKLIFHIFAALAEFERGIIRERTMAGLLKARNDGSVGGKRYKLTKSQVKMVQKMMRNRDVPIDEICAQYGITRPSLYNYVGPDGELRESGLAVLGGALTVKDQERINAEKKRPKKPNEKSP